jgi:DNA-binding transcriptional MerR regulator
MDVFPLGRMEGLISHTGHQRDEQDGSSRILIGNLSLMTRLTRKVLRIYGEKDILVPGSKEPLTGYRYYTVDQIELGFKVMELVIEIQYSLADTQGRMMSHTQWS